MIGKARFVAVYALLLGAVLYLNLHRDLGVPMKKSFQEFPGTLNRWRMVSEVTLPASVQEVLRASEVLYREYADGNGDRVALYVGYHDGGKESGEIHSPKHCLPGSGWSEVHSTRHQLAAAGQSLNLVRALYQKGDTREVFFYWYQVRGATISDEYSLKVAEILGSVVHRRRDASFIRISVPVRSDEKEAAALAEGFIRDFLPTIRQFLPT